MLTMGTLICKTPVYLVLIVAISLFQVRTIVGLTTGELPQLRQISQPSAGEPVKLFPVLQEQEKLAESNENGKFKLAVEPQYKDLFPIDPYTSTYTNAYGSWLLDKQFVYPNASLYGVCPTCPACPAIPACPANPPCPGNPSCSAQNCPTCPSNPECPTPPKCPSNPLCPSITCPQPHTCPNLSCPTVPACPEFPNPPTIPTCPSASSCPAIPPCPSWSPASTTATITTCGVNLNTVVTSANTGTINILFTSGSSTSCLIGISAPPPFTEVQLTCTAIPGGTGHLVGSPTLAPATLTLNTPFKRTINLSIYLAPSISAGARLTCTWSTN